MASKKKLLPGYFVSMQDSDGKGRYIDKLSVLEGFDPYESERSQWLDDVDLWPSITHIHLAMYLLCTPSRYTGEELLNYKSLDCYINFVSGWVREVLVKTLDDKRVVLGKVRHAIANDTTFILILDFLFKVNHSQRMSEKPLTPWVV